MRKPKTTRFRMVVASWLVGFALLMGCSFLPELMGSLPFLATPTFTPSPSPTITPTPTPHWQLSQRIGAPSGRYFEFGSLSPDGRYVLLSSQPESAGGAMGSPYLTLLDAATWTPLWEGPPKTQTTFAWLARALWFPAQGLVALLGVSPESAVLALVRIRDGQVVAERPFQGLYSPDLPMAGDGRESLWIVDRGARFLTRYRVPDLGQDLTVQGSKDETCCIFEEAALGPSGLAAIGWDNTERYNLVLWPLDGGQPRIFPLPYIYVNHSIVALQWGEGSEMAFIMMSNLETEVDSLVILDAATGSVRWTLTQEAFPLFLVDWLPSRGWLVAGMYGSVRLYTGPSTYEILRKERGILPVSLEAADDGQRWLLVTEIRAELWEWK